MDNLSIVEDDETPVSNVEGSSIESPCAAFTEETKYSCEYCGVEFGKVWTMYRHKKLCSPEIHDNMLSLARYTIQYFKDKINGSRNNLKKKIGIAKKLQEFLDNNELLDESYFEWLGKELGFGDGEKLQLFLNFATKSVNYGGRPTTLTLNLKLKVINFWKDHSQISVDRRNNQQYVYQSLKKVNNVAKNLH